MQNNVFLRLAQERYTTKHYNGQQIRLSITTVSRFRAKSLIRCLKFCV